LNISNLLFSWHIPLWLFIPVSHKGIPHPTALSKPPNAPPVRFLSYEGIHYENFLLNHIAHCKSNEFRPEHKTIWKSRISSHYHIVSICLLIAQMTHHQSSYATIADKTFAAFVVLSWFLLVWILHLHLSILHSQLLIKTSLLLKCIFCKTVI
jgi:hypothetical protein